MTEPRSSTGSHLRDAFDWYTGAGAEHNSRQDRQAVYIFAVVFLAANVTILGAALFYFVFDARATWLGNFVCIVFAASLYIPVIARKHRFGAEILSSVAVGLFCGALSLIYGADAGFNLHLLVAVLFLALACGTKRLGALAVVTAPLIALFILIPNLFPEPVPFLPITTDLLEFMFRGNVALVIGVTLVCFMVILRRTERAEDALELEHQRSEMLLENLLPVDIARRLKLAPN